MRRWAELVGAFTLLTRVPVGRLAGSHPQPAECVWAYPIVGAAVGLAGAMVLLAAMAAGMPQGLAALWALATTVLLAGGLHEDGLADTADGFGGGRTPERKLAIMRDSRIGSYGALALVFSVAIRAVAIGVAPRPLLLLVLAGALGRGAMLLPLLLLRPARPDGMAAPLAASGRTRVLAGLALAAVAAGLAPGAGAAALAAGLAVTAIAYRQIGGYTGDIFGATEQAAEACAMTALG